MTRIATHKSVIDKLKLTALVDCAGCQTNASAILAEIYADYRRERGADYQGPSSPFIRPENGFNIKNIMELKAISSANMDRFSKRARGYSMQLTVFGDNSCLLTTKKTGQNCKITQLVPWVFTLPQHYETDQCIISIPNLASTPQFSFPNEGGRADPEYAFLFKSHDHTREDPRTKGLRAHYLAQLQRDMLSIVRAIDASLPVSTGRNFIAQAARSEAVIPPNFSYTPTLNASFDHAGILSFLSPFLDANFPHAKRVHGKLYGRTVTPSGSIESRPPTEILIDGEKEHALGWALDALLDDESGPIPYLNQIAQTERGPHSICLLHFHKAGQSTAHEQIEATQIVNRYAKPAT